MLHWNLLSWLAFLSGVASVTVNGPKGGSVSLPLSIEENSSYRLTCGTKVAYGSRQNEQYKGRVIESGHGLIIRDLKTTDARKCILSIYGHGHGYPISYSYEIHVYDNLTGRIGKELVFADLPRDAHKVVHCNGAVCREMWIRERGVLNNRLNDSNGRLSIREFRASDAGSYRVLNSTGEALVTVNVTVSGTESEGNDLNSTDDQLTDNTEQYSWVWIVASLALVPLIIFIIKKTRQHLKNKQPDSYEVEMGESGRALEYSFVTDNHENDHHNDGYCCI